MTYEQGHAAINSALIADKCRSINTSMKLFSGLNLSTWCFHTIYAQNLIKFLEIS